MQNVEVDTKRQIFLRTDSFGTQKKFKEGSFWLKVDCYGGEGYAEELATAVLSAVTNLPEGVWFIPYESCMINGEHGCASVDFLSEHESLVSFDTLHWNLRGQSIEDVIQPKGKPPLEPCEAYQYVRDFIRYATGLDVDGYLKTVLSLDAITRNPDRHFGNLHVIRTDEGTYQIAPIFDNGQAFGQNYRVTPRELPYAAKMRQLTAKPFATDFEKQVELTTGFQLRLNGDKLTERLNGLPDSSAKEFLLVRIADINRQYVYDENQRQIVYPQKNVEREDR